MRKEFVVRKKNSLIMNTSYNLTLEEQRVILILCSMVKENDEDFKEYRFRIKDFLEMINVKDESKYTELPKIIKGLLSKPFEIREENKIIQLNWLCEVTYITNEGIIILKFSPTLKPYLLRLNELYTSYRLENVLDLKSKYSIRMYELLKCHEFKQRDIEIELGELRRILGVEDSEYPMYGNFKQRVLNVAKKEVSKKTDVVFDFSEIKDGRRVTAVCFKIDTNIKPENNSDKRQLEINQIELTEFQTIQEIVEFSDKKLSEQDAVFLLEVADGAVSKVKHYYTLAKQTSGINNLVGWVASAIRNEYKPIKSNTPNVYKNNSSTMSESEKLTFKREMLRTKLLLGDISREEYDKEMKVLMNVV